MMPCQSVLNIIALVLIVSFPSLLSGLSQSDSTKPDQPPGFNRLVERGAMASIDSPVFVSAEEADIPPDAWVLGVVISGEARAYGLSLLNSHEVVNDEIAGQRVAAVW
jgi:hypothetical protein